MTSLPLCCGRVCDKQAAHRFTANEFSSNIVASARKRTLILSADKTVRMLIFDDFNAETVTLMHEPCQTRFQFERGRLLSEPLRRCHLDKGSRRLLGGPANPRAAQPVSLAKDLPSWHR